jgi:Outer membrane protein beta-barrel domain
MRQKSILLVFAFLVLGLGVQPALAQKFEIHPYGGGFFPGHWRDNFQLKREGIYGVKAGAFIADRWELEGNLGYINHFYFTDSTAPKSRAFIWEVGPSVNFYSNLFQKTFPFLSVKAGGLTGFIGDPEAVGKDSADFANIAPRAARPVILSDHDTFFQFSYGGGLKAYNLAGPLGLRAEVRGRTMPNFFGNSVTWLETTGGLTFTWGER